MADSWDHLAQAYVFNKMVQAPVALVKTDMALSMVASSSALPQEDDFEPVQ